MSKKVTFEDVLRAALEEAVKDLEEEHEYFEGVQKDLEKRNFKEILFKLYDNLAEMTMMMADLGIPKDVIIKVAETGIEKANKKKEVKRKASAIFGDDSIEKVFDFIIGEINKNEE